MLGQRGSQPVYAGWEPQEVRTAFLHEDRDSVATARDAWLIRLQDAQSEGDVEQQRQIKERGRLAVMWPELLASRLLIVLRAGFLHWYLRLRPLHD